MQLDFYYDVVCPYAYLASRKIDALATRTGATLVYKPMLLGGVFRAIGAPDEPRLSPQKAKHNLHDMYRVADAQGVPLVRPEAHPRRSVEAMRAILAASDGDASAGGLRRATHALFAAYWAEGLDVADRAVIAQVLSRAGLDGAAIVARLDEPALKDELRKRTDEAVAVGVFGAPAMVVGDQLFWGQDRLPFVEAVLNGRPLHEAKTLDTTTLGSARGRTLELFFDYSSPYSYLAATQAPRIAALTGATLRLRPFLLGGLFRSIGQVDVPLFEFSANKRKHADQDIGRWAQHWQVPYRFPSRFPMNTVAALRATLAARTEAPRLVERLFRAYWAEDQDISDRQILAKLAEEVGLGTALGKIEEPEIKEALKKNGAEAVERGVFGAPTFIVTDGPVSDRTAPTKDVLFWGQDRFELIARALTGWTPPRG